MPRSTAHRWWVVVAACAAGAIAVGAVLACLGLLPAAQSAAGAALALPHRSAVPEISPAGLSPPFCIDWSAAPATLSALDSGALILSAGTYDDWVAGLFPAGHTIWITVTASDGSTPKAWARVVSAPIPWWNDQEGFQTDGYCWIPRRPDLVPGDGVFAVTDTGAAAQIAIGQLELDLDLDADRIAGELNAPWTEPLDVSCEVHEADGISFWVPGVDPNGGAFDCDFGAYGVDIVPGTNIQVRYLEPDGDSVYNHPYNPAPSIGIQQWAEGAPGEGGNLVLHLRYFNAGGMAAEGLVITQTLTGLTYLSATSGSAPTGAGSGPLVWHLPPLDPYSSSDFLVFVRVRAHHGATVAADAQISTVNPYNRSDPGDLLAVWQDTVLPNDTRLAIEKGARTGDPAPGSDLTWVLMPCNHGGTDSAALVVTDTLPATMTWVRWSADEPGWTGTATGARQLVFSRPSLHAGACAEIVLVAHVDAAVPLGTRLDNAVELYARNDLEPDDNAVVSSVWTGAPHTNLRIDMAWNRGQLVPGGEIRYSLQVRNTGNLPVGAFRITDTLPAGTSFVGAWIQEPTGLLPFAPDSLAAGRVVVSLPGLANGDWRTLELLLQIAPETAPGTLLVNLAELTPLAVEDSHADNVSSLTERVHPHGPNLRVASWGDWLHYGNGHYAWYRVAVENVGDVAVDAATLTDALPPAMLLDGEVATSAPEVAVQIDPSGAGFSAALAELHGGYRAELDFGVQLPGDPAQVVAGGQWFTNTAAVTIPPGDTLPADNTAASGLKTGPDLYITQQWTAGAARPGELITLTLAFGNDQLAHTRWWTTEGDVWVTATLSPGLELVAAQRRSWGWGAFVPDSNSGGVVAWNVGRMPPGADDQMLLTLRVAAVAPPPLVSHAVSVSTDKPTLDLEVDYADNSDSLEIPVDLPSFSVTKAYQSSHIAGMPVTFTLTVANSGKCNGTGIVLEDRFLGESVQLLISLLPAGDSALRSFTARLPCALGQVVNSEYAVVASTEGVASSPGPAVSIAVGAPTIVPSFSPREPSVEVGAALSFADSSTTNGRPIVGCSWAFGDGSPAVDACSASHSYAATGAYTVTLTVTDGCGFAASTERAVLVTNQLIYIPLIVRHGPSALPVPR